MFDLEQAISSWRTHMLVAGIKTPGSLEELESHLREEIEQRMKSGLDEQKAFEISVQQIGCADELKAEFNKTRDAKCVRRGKMLRLGIIGLTGTPILNLLGLFVFHRSSSVFFSDQWWSGWFPNYLLWTIFTIIGLVGGPANWKWLKATGE